MRKVFNQQLADNPDVVIFIDYPGFNMRIAKWAKKKGIKTALPTNSTLFINAEVLGINLFSESPAKKAPIIASIPANSAKKAPKNTIAKTKMYWEILSSTFLKNHRVIIGKKNIINKPKLTIEIVRRNQNDELTSPVVIPTITAKTSNAKISVIIVPPIATITAMFLVTPSLLIIGYAINVCEANILASKTDVIVENFRI